MFRMRAPHHAHVILTAIPISDLPWVDYRLKAYSTRFYYFAKPLHTRHWSGYPAKNATPAWNMPILGTRILG